MCPFVACPVIIACIKTIVTATLQTYHMILIVNNINKVHETSKIGAKSATADSYFGLIGPRQCSAALGGPAISTEDLRHKGA